ncbi:hypothetical protein TNCV_4642431 [Trichonephila clavipes]|nr:hypothetical protein TNCV_4642431 [Trichonephila clavipes]
MVLGQSYVDGIMTQFMFSDESELLLSNNIRCVRVTLAKGKFQSGHIHGTPYRSTTHHRSGRANTYDSRMFLDRIEGTMTDQQYMEKKGGSYLPSGGGVQ